TPDVVEYEPMNDTAPTPLAAALADLGAVLGDRLSTANAVRERHGKDETYHPGAPPDAVAFARTTEEVSRIVEICAARRIAVIPFGTGTSLEGHIEALRGGITIDLAPMNEVLEVNADDLDCLVQAGVTRKQLNADLRDTGLFFPIDPGADASLGGMAATRASGTNAVRYGTMRENVLGLTVVLADGRVIRTGGRARKSSAGYDLTRLFVGSEGTLGVITEIRLRLHGIPEAISSAVCPFPGIEQAVDTVIATIQAGVPVARIELLDELTMEGCIRYSKLEGYRVAPTLFFEFHGSEAGVAEQAETVRAIARDFGGAEFQWASRTEERNQLWQARHDAFYASMALRPGAAGIVTDVCLPISRLAEGIAAVQQDIKEAGLLAPMVGHVGDGNFHLIFLVDLADEGEVARAKAVNRRMIERTLAQGGTCTGEHGVGHGKIAYLEAEHGAGAVGVMRKIKQALDPDNIMNPGKIVSL
ncbi:MAG: lactate dehydrogenase, partial [Geminicoccaceae bacterium]|nr:lactate dehydrogenase [Geminicoccaceae bacterium]